MFFTENEINALAFPQVDTAIFQAHRHLWGSEDADKRFTGELTRLTDDEHALYDALRDSVLRKRLRLEQERVAYG